MIEQLLATKFYIPHTRPELVPRPHLIRRLNEGLHRKLTLISAPAGFGKTTLVSEWAGKLHQDVAKESQIVNRFAWLSLDERDNDLAHFLTYFVAALNKVEGIETVIGKGALGILQTPQPPPVEDLLTSLINEIITIPDRIILVLDDYHLIEAQPIHDALTFLLAHLSPQMHLVIATREDPHLPLARLRTRGNLTELRAVDLRFTSSEAAEFLNRVMGLDLSAEDIAALETRTEGWIAGLQLAAISMQGHKDSSRLIKSFSGSHRHVLDYLVEEVLGQQSETVQTFLLQTAVLDRFTGSLCDAITEQHNGHETLGRLEHANLFIVPLDEERRWYRYHHLFADLLRQRLRQMRSDLLPTLHHRASEWYEENGFIDEAIEFALRAQEFERAAHLIENVAETAWVRGEDTKLRRWLDGLPIEILFSQPQLCIYHAWSLLATGQQGAAVRSLQAAEQAFDSSIAPIGRDRLPGSDRMRLRGRVAATWAFMAFYQGNVPRIIQYARQALEYLPDQELSWRSTVINALGDAYDFKGEALAAYRTRLEAVEASKASGNSYQIMIANLKLAINLRQRGELPQVIEICQQQMQLADESGMLHTTVFGWLLAIWGEVLSEINDLEGALQKTKTGAELTERGDLAMFGWSYLCLMRVLFARGEVNAAEEIVQKMEITALANDIPTWITNLVTVWQIRIWLAQNKLEAASQWVAERGLGADGDLSYLYEMEYIVLARILIAQAHLENAIRLLLRLFKAAEAGGRTSRMIEIMMLQALAFQDGGDSVRAVAALEQALILAEPGGFVRIFVGEGQPIELLLKEMKVENGKLKEYIRKLLAAFSDNKVQPSSPVLQPLIEPLSARELEVLHLIAVGLTNSEIAARLYLSLNTVKVHTRNIYSKLEVHNRTQAVARTRALGILPSN